MFNNESELSWKRNEVVMDWTFANVNAYLNENYVAKILHRILNR